MIDPTKSPTSPLRKTATIVLLAVLIIAAGMFLYKKDFHHSTASAGTSPAPAAPAPVIHTKAATATTTTIPGGVPESNRNPFAY